MIRYAIMKDSGEFVLEMPVGRERFKLVNAIETATLYTKYIVAKDKLTAMKYHRESDINEFRIVEIEITYTVKELE